MACRRFYSPCGLVGSWCLKGTTWDSVDIISWSTEDSILMQRLYFLFMTLAMLYVPFCSPERTHHSNGSSHAYQWRLEISPGSHLMLMDPWSANPATPPRAACADAEPWKWSASSHPRYPVNFKHYHSTNCFQITITYSTLSTSKSVSRVSLDQC